MPQPSIVNAEIFERAQLVNDLTVTLYDWMADDVRDGRNLIAADRHGREVWRAKPAFFDDPSKQDYFTAIHWDGMRLTAHTWSGYRAAVDADTGELSDLQFTK